MVLESVAATYTVSKFLEFAIAGFVGNRFDAAASAIASNLLGEMPKNHHVGIALHKAFRLSLIAVNKQCSSAWAGASKGSRYPPLDDFVNSRQLADWKIDLQGISIVDLEQQIRTIYEDSDHSVKEIGTQRTIAFIESMTDSPLPDELRRVFEVGHQGHQSWANLFELFFADEVKANKPLFRILLLHRTNELVALATAQAEQIATFSAEFATAIEGLSRQFSEGVGSLDASQAERFDSVDNALVKIDRKLGETPVIRVTRNLIADATSDNIPDGLARGKAPMFREGAVCRLANVFTQSRGSSSKVALVGAPDGGKTTVLQALASELAARTARDRSTLAIMHVDLGCASRPLRAIADAIFERGADAFGESDPEEAADPRSSGDEAKLRYEIGRRVGDKDLLIVLEKGWEHIADPRHLTELTDFLQRTELSRAFVILEMRGAAIDSFSGFTPFSLEPYRSEEASAFLVSLGEPRERADEAIALLSDYARFYQPGPLFRGAQRIQLGSADATSFALAEAIETEASTLSFQMIGKMCELAGCETVPAFVSLQAMAVFGSAEFPDGIRALAGLAEMPLDAMRRLGWMNVNTRLDGFAIEALRASAHLVLGGKTTVSSPDALRLAIERLGEALLGNLETRSSTILDPALGWCERHVPGETALIARLAAMQFQESQADPIPVYAAEEQAEFEERFVEQSRDGNLEAALAALAVRIGDRTLASRAAANVDNRVFTDRAGMVAAMVESGSSLAGRQLLSLDASLYFGSRRHHAFDAVRDLRKRLYPHLAKFESGALEARDLVWLSGWLSFLLNMVDAELGAGKRGGVEGLLDHVRRLLNQEIRWHSSYYRHRLNVRLALLEERLAPGTAEALAALRRAYESSCAAMVERPQLARSGVDCLRVAQRMIRVVPEEAQRRSYVDGVRTFLVEHLGETCIWPVTLRSRMAALMRQEARRAWKTAYQRQRADEALRLLRTDAANSAKQVMFDAPALLTEARLLAFKGDLVGARRSCKRALEIAPSPQAWALKLRLIDEGDLGVGDWTGDHTVAHVYDGNGLPPDLDLAIRDLRSFASSEAARGQDYRKILLWAIQREWRAQGSIERKVANDLMREGRSYLTTPAHTKIELIEKVYNERAQRLRNFEGQRGTTREIALAKADNHAQFVRSVALHSHTQPDCESVLEIFDRALETWPNDHAIGFRKAEYHRYVWNLDEAIAGFRNIKDASSNGAVRREAAAALARSLHADALHGNLDAHRRQQCLTEAEALTDDLAADFDVGSAMVILKSSISLELNKSINWAAVDDAYAMIIGGQQDFPNKLIEEYAAVCASRVAMPVNFVEELLNKFADPEVLGLTGLLYLRSAQLKRSNDLIGDLEHAMGFFMAVGVIERSWDGAERALTTFRIATTILTGAEALVCANPLPRFSLSGRRTQIAWAGGRFQSVEDRSVGVLRTAARDGRLRAMELATAFTRREA